MDIPVHNLSRIFQMQSNEDRLNSTSFNMDRDMNVCTQCHTLQMLEN